MRYLVSAAALLAIGSCNSKSSTHCIDSRSEDPACVLLDKDHVSEPEPVAEEPEEEEEVDELAPVAGTAITVGDIQYTTLKVDWGIASDETTAASNLSYKLVISTDQTEVSTATLANQLTGSHVAMDWTVNTLTAAVSGLTNATQYYMNVLVRDEAGNISAYTVKSARTAAMPDTASLLSFWNFENNLADAHGNNDFTAAVTASYSTNPVKVGSSALSFNGSSQYLTSAIQFNGQNAFTMAGWIYVNAFPTNVNNRRVGFWGQNDLIEMGAVYKTGFTGFRLCLWVNGIGNDVCDSTDFPTGRWVHVAVTGSSGGSGKTEIFIDGVSAGTSAAMTAGTSSYFLQVGYGVWGGVSEYYLDGYVDELAVWTRVLSDSEITDLSTL